MPSPDATKIVIKCKETERDEVKRLATLQGLTIQRYALKRLLMPYVDRDLEDCGWGLVMRKLIEKGYPKSFCKKVAGNVLKQVIDAPDWSPEYERYLTLKQEQEWDEELRREREKYEQQ